MKRIFMTIAVAAGVLAAIAQPKVVTDTRFVRGATQAFGRMTVTTNGAVISKRGFCFSDTSKEPTIADNVTKTLLSSNGAVYRMQDLKPSTRYYARAYATTNTGETYYGNVIKFYTVPKGTVAYSYDFGGSADENTRIDNAVKSCVNYWNDLTSIQGFFLNVHYGASTPTADCSYGGWMRVGPNASYQRTGTIMHEALHGIGVGTDDCGIWRGNVMRAGEATGQWLGDRATECVRFWDNNTTSVLTGDNTHMWPYGINGAHEDDGSDLLYTITSTIAQALGEDGLPATSGMRPGTPYYAFDQEDDVKYYIKNESETGGLFSSFLTEVESNKMEWTTMTTEQAKENDAAAWYVTFNPVTQYYQFRNAKTGNYMTYSFAGLNGIKTVKRTATQANDNFHLMRSRVDVGTGNSTIAGMRGYWILHPDATNATPACLATTTNNRVTTQSFNRANTATAQRWLILTADEAEKFDSGIMQSARAQLNSNMALVKGLADTPHIDVVEGATARFNDALAQIIAQAETAANSGELQTLADEAMKAGKTFLASVQVADMDKPFDLTAFITNPGFDGNDGWTTTGANKYSCIEFYQKTATAQQVISDMPLGSYAMKVQGFQRPGSNDQVYADYNAGKDNCAVAIWINETKYGKTVIRNVMSDRQTTQIKGDSKQMADKTYVPNGMESSAACFANGLYDNEVRSYIPSAGNLTLIIRGANSDASFWTIFDNVRLYYYGGADFEDIEKNIETAADGIVEDNSTTRPLGVYTLQGIKVADTPANLAPGMYIHNGRTVVKKD